MASKRIKQLSTLKKVIVPLLRKNGVVRAGIFGSYARGEATQRSDIDILIQFKGNQSLLDMVRMERELKEKLGKKIEILTYNSISPYLKERILHEEVRIL